MMITARLYRNGWRPMHLAMLVGLLAAAIVVAWQAWADLAYQAWRDEESSHILLVPVVAAWLIWIRRARFQRLVPLSCWVGTLIVAGGWLLYSTGDTYLVETFWYLGAILLAASRAIGETMIVVMAAGAIAKFSVNPFEAMTTITTRIVSQLTGDTDFASPETLVAFALGLTLFVITLGLNIFALYIVRKYREQYE